MTFISETTARVPSLAVLHTQIWRTLLWRNYFKEKCPYYSHNENVWLHFIKPKVIHVELDIQGSFYCSLAEVPGLHPSFS